MCKHNKLFRFSLNKNNFFFLTHFFNFVPNFFMKKITYLIFLAIFFSCESNKEVQEVNLYSQRHYAVDELQYENFTKLTGIKVNVTKANAD